MPRTLALVALYLGAIVAGNLAVTHYGPEAVIVVAFAAIGLDLTVRDALHDAWGRHRLPAMAALIAAGSALSYLVNADAGRVALASLLAFAAAGTVDALIYHAARRRPWLERANVSNVAGAAVDSLVFPTVAFGAFSASLTFGQWCAKVAGGAVLALVLVHVRRPVAAPA